MNGQLTAKTCELPRFVFCKKCGTPWEKERFKHLLTASKKNWRIIVRECLDCRESA